MATKMSPLFKGKETAKTEKGEARAVKSGKMSASQYARGEKSEGEKDSKAALMKRAASMKSGKMSAAQYAKSETK